MFQPTNNSTVGTVTVIFTRALSPTSFTVINESLLSQLRRLLLFRDSKFQPTLTITELLVYVLELENERQDTWKTNAVIMVRMSDLQATLLHMTGQVVHTHTSVTK